MPDIIQLLPDSVANQIAAGEVIQRPASVVKELMENAIDAGASTVMVRIEDAGRTLVQVIDNGKGMSVTDARLSFERHSTSKIRQAGDLFALRTMGFRGEALASIAAVAQVELRTRMADDEIGTRLCISGSRVVKQEPVSCPVGSNFSVENLFFNVPARRKFLKSNSTELNNIITAFERIVLVYPQTAFTLYSNDVETMTLRPASTLQRIVDIFGKKTGQDLLPLSVDTSVCRIEGFVGKPQSAKKKGAHQFFFVNGRYMRHPYFNKAVQYVFERLVPAGEQVPYFIYIDINPEDIDVNIHPTKTEIKFENEQTIWQIISAAVKDAIGRFSDIPAIDFDTQGRPDIPVAAQSSAGRESFPAFPVVAIDRAYNPFDNGFAPPKPPERTIADAHLPEFYVPEHAPTERQQPQEDAETVKNAERSAMHFQYKGQYILTAVKSGLMIIDQHRAHLRVLYDGYMRQIAERKGVTQRMLFPEIVKMSASDDGVLKRVLPEMEAIGFEITPLGGGSYVVSGVPTGLDAGNIAPIVEEIVASAGENSGIGISEEFKSRMALSLARGGAIPYGQLLSNDEMENIVNNLFACDNVNYTPNGKKILSILPQQDIESLMR